MIMPHIPSWPTTSYNGDFRTKNSSVALAVDVFSHRDALEESRIRTESVKCGTNDHEGVTLTLTNGRIILVREFVRANEKTQSEHADEDALKAKKVEDQCGMIWLFGGISTHDDLCPMIPGSHINPCKEHTARNGPAVYDHQQLRQACTQGS